MTERQLRTAVHRYAEARDKRDAAIVKASADMSYRRIAEIVGLSHSRIQQIVKGGTP